MTWPERAADVIPEGANTLSKQWRRYGAGTPPIAKAARGAFVYDDQMHPYYDLCCGLGAVTLGHGDADLLQAIYDTVTAGQASAAHLPTTTEVEVSEKFCEAIGADQVRWVSSGSEASEGACRIARIATGRELILSVGYHSWYSTFTAAKPQHPGCPESFRSALKDVPYNDLAAIEELMGDPDDEVAAVIIEPTSLEAPKPGYLEGIRKLCADAGALLIFDEVITGFRFHLRGGAGYFNVEPDLQIYGKSITNGLFPVGAIVGPREWMQHAWPVSGTANAHPLGMAVVGAVVDKYLRDDVITKLWANGEAVKDALKTTSKHVRFHGWAVRPMIAFDDDHDAAILTYFTQRCAAMRLLWQPAGSNVMACWTQPERSAITSILALALLETLEAWEDGRIYKELAGGPLTRSPIRPVPTAD